MTEHVIIVRDVDGDVIGVVRPDDPLNPQFSADLIMLNNFDVSCEVEIVNSVDEFNEAR